MRLATNLRGWKTSRKLLIFESDDWGAMRMPSREVWRRLRNAGINVDNSNYDRLDCLESRDDFQALMNVIDTHRDAKDRPPIFTMNTVMGNPDFEAIERDKYQRFHHQHFFHSYMAQHGEDLRSVWFEARRHGLIQPQFHAREHLNVPLWMRDLKSGHVQTRVAFAERFYGLTTRTSSERQKNYLASFWAESPTDLESISYRLREGLGMFRQTFGFRSTTFIPCNYIFPTQAEPVLKELGVGLLQGQRGQFLPSAQGSSGQIIRTFTGQATHSGLLRSVRNVMFEPFETSMNDPVSLALRQISQSFRLGKPAIVSTHRVNFSGGINVRHRDRSLRLLHSLISEVRRRWPQVEFMSSDELLEVMLET